MIEIIEGNEGDIPAIVQMAEKTWRATYVKILTPEEMDYMLTTIYGREALKKVMQNGSQKFLLLKDGNGSQGFVAFGPRKEDPGIFKVHKLYVLPSNQGKGYGTLLIEEVKSRMRLMGVATLDLNVNRHNPAKEFYGKLGFEIIGEEDVPIGPFFMNDYVMRLKI
jgi:diamine N-acetyltransferase